MTQLNTILSHGGSHEKTLFILAGLIGLVLIAMLLPWGHIGKWAAAPGEEVDYYYQYESYLGSMFLGSLYLGLSFIFALAAFVSSFFSRKSRICCILCGLSLLGSAGLCLYEGIWEGFDCFTALTWGIFGALVLLGLWTLFFFRTKPKNAT